MTAPEPKSVITETLDQAPEDIRKAVKQLSFAYKRSSLALQAETAQTDEGRAMAEAMRCVEAVLFSAGQPVSAEALAEVLPHGIEPAAVLMALKQSYQGRGVELVEVAGKWRFQTAPDLYYLFVEERHEQKKLSQAALETLAIIAYGQPVSRAEIEAVRGVAVSKGTIDTLQEAGWIKIKGRRKTPGRPATYGTTDAFLEHFGLESLSVLPGKADLEAEGLLSNVIPADFQLPGEEGLAEEETDAELMRDGEDEDTRADTGFMTDFYDTSGEAAE